MTYTYNFPRPSVACETVLFDLEEEVPLVLLTLRNIEPFKDMWCLPGGFLEENETLIECAIRELNEETGIDLAHRLRQTAIFWQPLIKDKVDRDPRGRVISVVYTVVVDRVEYPLCAGDDAAAVAWFRMDELPELAADHLETIREVLGEVYHDRC